MTADTRSHIVRPTLASSVARVFNLALGQMLWSRRTFFLALLTMAPVVAAAAIRVGLEVEPAAAPRLDGSPITSAGLFGVMVWILYLRFIVPVLGVFYGTGLIADEVDDKTITYLFVRPIQRSAILLGKYLAYVVCTLLLTWPSIVLVYLLLLPAEGSGLGTAFPALVADLGALALGVASYGALFAFVGARLKRPLVIGLVYVFGWEPAVLLFPGYLKRLTIGYYLQALVPHAMPDDQVVGAIMRFFSDIPAASTSLTALIVITAASLWLAGRAVERREYVLEQ